MSNCIKIILLTFLFISTQFNDALAMIYGAYDPDKGYQGNSLQEYEEYKHLSSDSMDCFSSGKIFIDGSALSNTYLPDAIGYEIGDDTSSVQGWQTGAAAIRAVSYAAMTQIPLIGWGVAAVAAGIDYALMDDVCRNSYVFRADEWASLGFFNENFSLAEKAIVAIGKEVGLDMPEDMTDTFENICKVDVNEKEGVTSVLIDNSKFKVFAKDQIPYMFHCDPNYDPKTNSNASPDRIGLTYGYQGSGSALCNDPEITDTVKKNMKERIGRIMVGYWPKIDQVFRTGPDICRLDAHGFVNLKAGEEKAAFGTFFYAFYYQVPETGKIRLCAISPYTMFPVLVGCTTIAPPAETQYMDPFIKEYVANTRCAYLLRGRDDLHALAQQISNDDTKDRSVIKFLKSDLHLTSTVTGCIKDLLMLIFMDSPASNVSGDKPFFQVVQGRLKQIVLAALILYVSLTGIKIITAGQPPSRAEAVMYFIKFALVIFFATGDAWYKVENNKRVGLYPALINTSEEISSLFLEAQNVNDPLGMCYFDYNGRNILANRDIPISEGNTDGYPGIVKTTVWDLVDCKVISYLSLGSCNYSISGLMTTWLGGGMILTNFALGISLIIYSIMVMITVFKFAHIFILSLFTITILVFLSPIFILLALFEPTKGMFQKWMQMILGYTLYPALLFAFVAIMFATFDSIMYGNLDLKSNASNSYSQTLEKACQNVDSIFCTNIARFSYNHPCGNQGSALTDDLITKGKVKGFGDYKKVNEEYAESIKSHVGKLLLFAFLFYLFLGSITEFMAVLVGVQSLGGMAKGIGAPLSPITRTAGLAARTMGSAMAKKVGRAVGRANR